MDVFSSFILLIEHSGDKKIFRVQLLIADRASAPMLRIAGITMRTAENMDKIVSRPPAVAPLTALLSAAAECNRVNGFTPVQHGCAERAGLQQLKVVSAFSGHPVCKKGIIGFAHLYQYENKENDNCAYYNEH